MAGSENTMARNIISAAWAVLPTLMLILKNMQNNQTIKQTYTCPMHPEVVSDEPGRCPKCKMSLVEKGTAQEMSGMDHHAGTEKNSYTPLIVIISILFVASLAVGIQSLRIGAFSFSTVVESFMIGFFITFAAFKLMDLKGFAQGYSTYDLLAMRWFEYGYVYPFIELFFGLVMLAGFITPALLAAEVLVMGFSGIGVAIKIAKKEKFQCACLGTFLKVPLTKVTLIEDFGMAFLALVMLFLI